MRIEESCIGLKTVGPALAPCGVFRSIPPIPELSERMPCGVRFADRSTCMPFEKMGK